MAMARLRELTHFELAGPFITLNEGLDPWTEPKDLPLGASRELEKILDDVKSRILPGEHATKADLDSFVGNIFIGWKTGDWIIPPADTNKATLNEVSIAFGIMTHDAVASSAESKIPRNRSKAREALESLAAPATLHEHRKRDNPIYLMVEYKKNYGFQFSYRDRKSGFLSTAQGFRFTNVKNMDDAYFYAMKNHDRYYVNKVHEYNLAMVMYVARNRITNWRNGAPVTQIPAGEHLDLCLGAIHMIKYETNVPMDASAALQRLKALPAPKMYRYWYTAQETNDEANDDSQQT